jgi:DNA-binding SARP family transcriptional activator
VDFGTTGAAGIDPEDDGTSTVSGLVEGVPASTLLETANFLLADALGRSGRAHQAPSVRLVRAGPDGVELVLASPVDWAPEPWRRSGPTTWWIPAELGTADSVDLDTVDPWIPALVALGDGDRGTWYGPVGAGTVLAVLGTGADDLVWQLRLTAESWTWADRLTVTDDATVAEMAATGAVGPVIFFGDAADLTDVTSARCGIVTTTPTSPTDLTLLVDESGITVQPLGLTLHPCRMVGPDGIVSGDISGPDDPVGDDSGSPRPATGGPATSGTGVVRSPARSISLAPGPVEVRLLTSVPRIEGLNGELTPKRARRVVELVAYLALHFPDVVTGDRLRTRVLGTAETDAAAKTLFNTVGAVRRALGSSPSGDPYLPLATKSGHYRISGSVTVDAARAVALVAAADDSEPRRAMALLREALSLVEGEPLVGALSGYSWWIAEGHERRTATALVDAACRLARLAGHAGHLDLARWAVDRARLVEPYSESLSRAAMEVAAEAGDTDALRHEWEDCRRRVDEIDPGGSPAPATEQLYTDLRSSWLAASTTSQR